MLLRPQHGFTLLEILVALFIFLIVALMASQGLHTVLTTKEITEKNASRLAQLQIAMLLLERDITQAIDRPILDAVGQKQPALKGDKNYLELTHAGFANPFGIQQRSTLQRVRYQFDNGKLMRITWDVLDRIPATQPVSRTLIDNIRSLQWRFIDDGQNYYDSWPASEQAKTQLPKGIEIRISLKNQGNLLRLFFIPGKSLSTL